MKGQGIAEYVFILVFTAVILIVLLALLGPSIDNIIANMTKPQEVQNLEYAQQVFDYRNRLVTVCLKSEAYTREECIVLASGGQP